MPTYEYICSACGHAFERFESITAKPNKECEKCGKKKAERQISAGAGIIFKGSGFYVTDYKGAGKPDPKSADSKSKSSDTKPAETKSGETSKPAAESSSTPAATSTPAPAPAKSESSSKSTAKSSSKKK